MSLSESIPSHLEVWSSALLSKSSAARSRNSTKGAYGIGKLRELILGLAARGKLIPQDVNDEPASDLLTRIRQKKDELVRESGTAQQKPLPKIDADEKAFHLPPGWEWSRLVGVTAYLQRGKGPEYATDGHVRVVSQKCVQWSGFDPTQARFVDDASVSTYQIERFLRRGDLLWNSTGTGTVGRVVVVPTVEANSLVADSHITVVRPLLVSSGFLRSYIASPAVQQRIASDHAKALVSGTTNQVELNLSAVAQLVVPIPPLAEQDRIALKVDELMSLCDQLEQEQARGIEAHGTLVMTLLGRMTSATSPQPFGEARTRVASHFDSLFDTEESIDELKRTTRHLAVMGKLVPQELHDEPASVLLSTIAKVKVHTGTEGQVRRLDQPLTVGEADTPFRLPKNWSWTRFGNIVIHRSELVRPEDHEALDQVGPDSIEKGTGRLRFRRTVRESGVRGPNNRFHQGQILYSKIRPSLSKAIIAPFEGLCSADMYPLDSLIDSSYLLMVILSEPFLAQVRVAENRIKMPKLNIDSLSRIVVPVPPLAEQRRIVTKVNELMALCDALSARLAEREGTLVQLADAIVDRAVA